LAEVDAFDVSPEALKVAKENAKLNRVNVNFREIDIFNPPAFSKKMDLIVSNPPYVPEKKKVKCNAMLPIMNLPWHVCA
jgi:release factor glutamine methyltransferase